jgi:hypothetical protein
MLAFKSVCEKSMIQLSNIQWLFLFKDKGVLARASIYVSLVCMSFSSLILLYN